MKQLDGSFQEKVYLKPSTPLHKEDLEKIITNFFKENNDFDSIEIDGLPEYIRITADATKALPAHSEEQGDSLLEVTESRCFDKKISTRKGFDLLVAFSKSYLKDKLDNVEDYKDHALLAKTPIKALLENTFQEVLEIINNPQGRGIGRKTQRGIKETLVHMGYKEGKYPFL